LTEIMAGTGSEGRRQNGSVRREREERNGPIRSQAAADGSAGRVRVSLAEYIRRRGRLMRPLE
jgi:hypothetical protein